MPMPWPFLKDEAKQTIPEKELIEALGIVMEVNDLEWPKNSMAMKEDEVDPDVLKRVNKYMGAAIKEYLAGNPSVTRKVLIHMLYIYPDYPKAQYFLTRGFTMPPGSFKVKDQVDTLIKRSDHYFYGAIT